MWASTQIMSCINDSEERPKLSDIVLSINLIKELKDAIECEAGDFIQGDLTVELSTSPASEINDSGEVIEFINQIQEIVSLFALILERDQDLSFFYF